MRQTEISAAAFALARSPARPRGFEVGRCFSPRRKERLYRAHMPTVREVEREAREARRK